MYKVLTPLLKDGDRIEVDQTVDLDKKAAAELLAVGAVEKIPAATKSAAKGEKAADPDPAKGEDK